MHFLYSLLTAAGFLLLLPYFLVAGLRGGKYRHGLGQRLGFLPASLRQAAERSPGAIWIHAVSVGEVLAALPLGERLKQHYPQSRVVLSTTTLTGQRLARQRAGFADAVFYFPLDWAGPVRRALRAVRPALVVIVETEIWPNFLRQARRAGVPVVFVNGRISERSFARYRRLLGLDNDFPTPLFPVFARRVLADAEMFLMQSPADAERLLALGAPAERVAVTGNLKYDAAPPGSTSLVTWLEEQVTRQERRPLAVAGSVVAEEEEAVLAGFDVVGRRWRRALLVLAPRKPERFDAAERIAGERGWRVARRSALHFNAPLDDSADVLLLDTVGELAGLYRLADVVFVGGSLQPAGGHNPLEPAWFARAPVFGPSMENFRHAAEQLLAARAAVRVESGEALGRAWVELIEDQARRAQMGAAARAVVERNRGATERSLERIAAVLDARQGRP